MTSLSCKALLLLLLVLILSFGEQSPFLPNYDIWNDGAKIPARKKDRSQGVGNVTPKEIKKNAVVLHDRAFINATAKRKGKILNFFYSTDEEECLTQDGRRSGLCMNPYTCRMQDGTSSGTCAYGFGVCCLFVVSCGKEIKNNVTYFVSPEFPSLARSLDNCNVVIKKIEGASQLRLDFVHFNLGQPNRLTGDCDSDVFVVSGGNSKDFRLCGLNSDQHVYYDLDKAVNRIVISMRLSRPNVQRLWEIKVSQIPFGRRAPAGCLQYYTKKKGVIQTLNFAENGRHLANQDYNVCVRPSKGMCSISYQPCDPYSFRIGRSAALNDRPGYGGQGGSGGAGNLGGPGSLGGPGGINGDMNYRPPFMRPPDNLGGVNGVEDGVVNQPLGDPAQDELAGSGDGIGPDLNNEISSRQFAQPNPYSQHLGNNTKKDEELWRYWGYGNYGYGVSSFGRQRCQDRIITPCDGDEFLPISQYNPGVCDPFHCGLTLCPELPLGRPCRIESSVKPFSVGVKFGPAVVKSNPEENIGACLNYEQLPCAE